LICKGLPMSLKIFLPYKLLIVTGQALAVF